MRATALLAETSDGRRYREHSEDEKEEADHLIPKDMDGPCHPREDMER
jgi:hypothetical protein